jgi:hypothetical protein
VQKRKALHSRIWDYVKTEEGVLAVILAVLEIFLLVVMTVAGIVTAIVYAHADLKSAISDVKSKDEQLISEFKGDVARSLLEMKRV